MLCGTHGHGVHAAPAGSAAWARLAGEIRDWERNEPPHVTIIRKQQAWRFGIRTPGFLDKEPDPKDVPDEVVAEVERNLDLLRREWDARYPENPVDSTEVDDDE